MFSRLYLHIPWCLSKCGYCAFYSAPGDSAQLAETVRLLLLEMELAAEHYPAAPLASIYLGGGTPSLLEPEQVGKLLERSRQLWGHQNGCEITLEANPGTVTPASLTGFRQAGVNRLSLGVQVFDDHTLALLGRQHREHDARESYYAARAAGFDNIGLDLICGLPGQTLAHWQLQLQKVSALMPEHLSIYSLSIEAGTPFERRYDDANSELPDDDQTAAMLESTDQLLTSAGYEHYEIANFARSGHRSQHNTGYWQRDGYLGLGPSAHSLLLTGWGVRCSNPASYRQWATQLANRQLAHGNLETLTQQQALSELLFLGLRTLDGISPSECLNRFGADLWASHAKAIADLLTTGLLEARHDRITLTKRGMLLANQVFVRFV